MALKQLLLRKRMEEARSQLAALEETGRELEQKRAAMNDREAELETAVEEVTAETPQEERDALDEATTQFESDNNALGEEEKTNAQERQRIQDTINELQKELDDMAERAEKAARTPEREERSNEKPMETRKFFGMNTQERDAFFARGDVKEFLQRVRALKGETRAINGAELLIPTVVTDLIRENVGEYSKLHKHVRVMRVPGKSRMPVMGEIPEGVWTEMCATLNELALTFYEVEMDGYKVGGYISICNAILEDSDIALATEIINALGAAIGLALDKAILYGTGTKMPLGIVTRLAQTAKPGDYAANARPWVKLSETNILAISGKTDAALFKALIEASGAAKGKHSRGQKFWAMNEKTHMKLVANALSINAAGAVVTGVNGTMPIIGGAIEELSFIPDDVIIGGYGDMYPLAERAGTTIGRSEHVRFIEDQTVFKGTARYDGKPAIAEAFVAIGLDGNLPAANAVTFAQDTAN